MRTAQEIFDTVVGHLRKQCKRSWHLGWCCYRGDDGTSCAVGCLIPDEQYSPSMEGKSVQGLIIDDLLSPELKLEFTNNRTLLSDLQQIHDLVDIQYWEKHFENVADKFNLIYTPRES